MVWLALNGRKPCAPETGSYCDARRRVPLGAITRLVRLTAQEIEGRAPDGWLGGLGSDLGSGVRLGFWFLRPSEKPKTKSDPCSRGGKSCDDVRYYILSKRLSARGFGAAVRGHWSIENSLHWQLDMSFAEDRSRIRKGHADANFAVVRRMALSLLKNERSQKVGVKSKRLGAGWNDDYLGQVLFGT